MTRACSGRAVRSTSPLAFRSVHDTREVPRFDTKSGEMIHIAFPANAQGTIRIYPTPDGHRLWAADQGLLLGRPASDLRFEIAVAEATVLRSVRVGQGAQGVVVSHDGAQVYATNVMDKTVSVVDPTRGEQIAVIPVGAEPSGISYWWPGGGMP